MATRSETSTTKFEELPKAFITFRVVGDALVPEEVTKLLNVRPSHAHRKGQPYSTGRSNVVPVTGTWFFSTDGVISSGRLSDHLSLILVLFGLNPASSTSNELIAAAKKFLELKVFLEQKGLKATMTFFWHGAPQSDMPTIPNAVSELFALVPIAIEFDFDKDEAPPKRSRAAAA